MAWCLAKGVKVLDQRAIQSASLIALMRDERHGRVAVRFRTVSSDLSVRSGFLGQGRFEGTGADNLSKTTLNIMKRACSRFYGAPDGHLAGHLKAPLLKLLREKVVVLCADSAADEMASAEIMRSAALSVNGAEALTPNLQHVFRDRAHASRRLTSRPWHADPKLKEIMDYMCRGASMAKIMHHSVEIKRIFSEYAKTSNAAVQRSLNSFRAAGHRFESFARPLGRTLLYFHATLKTALHLVRTRTDSAAKRAKAWLLWISEERLVQAAMLADAADSSLALTRALDEESTDPAVVHKELHCHMKEVHSLFVGKKCLQQFGYTSTVLDMLKSPIVFQVGKDLKSIGSSHGVASEKVDRCFGAMQAWVKLADSAIQAEFPDFEVIQAYDIFNLGGLSNHSEKHLRILAHAFKLDERQLEEQWKDMYPRAQLAFRVQVGKLKDSTAKGLARQANKEAWKETIASMAAHHATQKAHPTNVLRTCLENYFVCTPSTSGVEQNFSKVAYNFTKQRHHALASHEELVLKLFVDLPQQTVSEQEEICRIARVAWSCQYGAPRERKGARVDKGLKRNRDNVASDEKCPTETDFIKRRRRAAAAAAEDYQLTDVDVNENFWTANHDKENTFLKNKTAARKSQAIAEDSLPLEYVTEEEKQQSMGIMDRFELNQQKRRRQALRHEKAAKEKDRGRILAELHGGQVYLAVPATVHLQAALANAGLTVCHNMLEADVLICHRPGDCSEKDKLSIVAGVLGRLEACPDFFLRGSGAALKFHCAASARRALIVSAECAQRHLPFWQMLWSVLPPGCKWTLHKMASDASFQDMTDKQRDYPQGVGYLVVSPEERSAVAAWLYYSQLVRVFTLFGLMEQ